MPISAKDALKVIRQLATVTDGSGYLMLVKKIIGLEPGTTAASLGKAEDAAHASGDVGVSMLAVRRDTRAVGSGTDGDYSAVAVDANGSAYVVSADKRVRLPAVPTTAAGAYAIGDVVGTLMSFSGAARFSGGSGVVESFLIADKANVISNVDVVLFAANPTNSTFTDNAAYTVDVLDWDKIVCAENVDYTFEAAGNRVCKYVPPGPVPFVLDSGTTLYAVLVARTAFTLASATDLKLFLTIRQD